MTDKTYLDGLKEAIIIVDDVYIKLDPDTVNEDYYTIVSKICKKIEGKIRKCEKENK